MIIPLVQVSPNWQGFTILCLAQLSSPCDFCYKTDSFPVSALCLGWDSLSSGISLTPNTFKKKSLFQFSINLSGLRLGTPSAEWVKHSFLPLGSSLLKVLSSQLHFRDCCFSEEKYALCYFHEIMKNHIIFLLSHLSLNLRKNNYCLRVFSFQVV